jgi:hypothetical protein
MNDKLDEAIKGCFADRRRPSDETRAVIRKKLFAAERRREMLRDWAVMAYAIIFSSVFTVAARVFVGGNAIFYLCLSNLFLSIIGGAAITIVCQRERKGGVADVVVCD